MTDHPTDDPLDRARFPVRPWSLAEAWYDARDAGVTETLFAVGNGYLGMRGNPEEGRVAHSHGTYLNGFHETWPIHHAEQAFGFARTGQTIVEVPDAKTIQLFVDDEPLLLGVADLDHYERELDLAAGVLRRDLMWRTPAGKHVRVRSTRMVSFTQRHLAVLTMEVTLLDADAPVVLSSQLLNRQDGSDERDARQQAQGRGDRHAETQPDPRRASGFPSRVLVPQLDWHEEQRCILGYRCAHSGMTVAVGADHQLLTQDPVRTSVTTEPDLATATFSVDARRGVPVTLTKLVAYHSSRGVPVRDLAERARRTLDRVREQGPADAAAEQRSWLDRFWADGDVQIAEDDAAQQAVRWNLFQLAAASARADQLGISAKGVSGSGYEGHYFWDSEIYVLPFLTYTSPQFARNALRFRISNLPEARIRAGELAQVGALFPWRTINGKEASAYYAAGTAQYHIDADIAFALARYVDVTGDEEFLLAEGAELLAETARMWADLGFWRDTAEGRSFHIHGVTGPDEYTTVVDDNLYTNVMARFNLQRAAATVRRLADDHPAEYAALADRIGLDAAEPREWEACAADMVIPYDETLGVHPQDAHFLERELWDLAATPESRRPLLLHFHPLVIYRFQVLKQADVVLALFLQGDTFSAEQKRADFAYYDPITTGDSSLSAVVQSIIAAEVGYADMAWSYFLRSLYVDLADRQGNTEDGVHVASTGGVWSALVYGFGGLRDHGGELAFDPRLPRQWPSLGFGLRVRDTRLRVRVEAEAITFHAAEGPGLTVTVRGSVVQVPPGEPVRVGLAHQGGRLPSLTGSAPVVGTRRADGSLLVSRAPVTTARVREPHGGLPVGLRRDPG